MSETYTLDDLRYLMRRLRNPESGCPWDIKQDFLSITPSTIEEAYEVVEAIERGDKSDVCEELGDLLFQVIFYAQLAEEEESFTFNQIVDGLTQKLIRRHPHVFPDGSLSSERTAPLDEEGIKAQWESIKAAERAGKGKRGVLDDIPHGLPAITRAVKVQKRAAQSNFDWASVDGVFDKMQEEIAELQQAVKTQDPLLVEDELGDVLFTSINLARHLKVEPESALRRANTKFSTRFEAVVELANQRGIDMNSASDDQLDNLWQAVKA